jgi:hypothetical protein
MIQVDDDDDEMITFGREQVICNTIRNKAMSNTSSLRNVFSSDELLVYQAASHQWDRQSHLYYSCLPLDLSDA